MSQTISSKFGHGGARANSGGIRLNSGGARPGAGRPWKLRPVEVIPTGSRWYVYQTHPQAERLAASELTRAGYRGYLPLIAIRKRDPVIASMFHKVLAPRFVGYGFVELSAANPWLPTQEIPGILRLLKDSDGHPSPIGPGELEQHMAQDDELCDLARETLPRMAVGGRVSILVGSLSGFEGVVVECDGLTTTVSVVCFNRPLQVRLDRASVETV